MRKVVLMKNALQDRSALQSPIGPMPRTNLTPPCPILMHETNRSQTPPPPSHSRARHSPITPTRTIIHKTTQGGRLTPPVTSRRLSSHAESHAVPRAVHQPIRFNSPPPTSVFMAAIHHPHPHPPIMIGTYERPSQACTVESHIPTPPIRSKCPCCC